MQICSCADYCPSFPSSIESKGGRRPEQGRIMSVFVFMGDSTLACMLAFSGLGLAFSV